MIKEEVKYWAGLVAAACLGLMGAAVVPHPYDKIVMGLMSVAGAIAAYNITPKKSQ